MNSLDSVHKYFDREAGRFNAIYDYSKPLYQQIGDRLFRRCVLERYSLVVNAIGGPGQKILDVGCGPGRYGIELAKRGNKHTVGVDVAEAMIDIARRESTAAGVADYCKWIISDFLSAHLGDEDANFDAVIAMGYYDYLSEPLPHLQKMIVLSNGRVYISFPKRLEIRTPIRVLRFMLARGFVRFYSRREIVDLFRVAGLLPFLAIVDLGRDYIAIYDAGGARSQLAASKIE